MTRFNIIRTPLILIIFVFLILFLSASMADAVINYQCNEIEPDNDLRVSIYQSNDHYTSAELDDYIDCKFPNVSLSGNDCIIQTNHDGNFYWINPYILHSHNFATSASLVRESHSAFDSALAIYLLKESFLI